MHQTQWSPERPLPPPVSLASQSQHEKTLRSPAQVEGTQGFLPQPGKDLERPSSTRLDSSDLAAEGQVVGVGTTEHGTRPEVPAAAWVIQSTRVHVARPVEV